MKCRYVEFKDKLNYRREVDGKLWLVGEPTEELVSELELNGEKHYRNEIEYYTYMANMGEKGWELQIVTPCGVYIDKGNGMAGPIENLYIFRKEISED